MNKTIGLYMSKPPICIKEFDSIQNVIDKLNLNHFNQMPVVNEKDKLCGMISKSDVYANNKNLLKETTGRTYSTLTLNHKNVNEVMSTNIVKLKASDSIDLAIEVLLQEKFHSIPVVDDDNHVIGVVNALDLLKGYYEYYG